MGSALIEVGLKVSSPEELAERYYPNGRLGGLSINGKTPGALGQLVRLRVDVARPARQFLIKVQLAWARHKAGPGQPAGYGLDFLPDEDATRVRLLAFARKELAADATRAELRQHVELPVRLVHQGRPRTELVADLSPGGAFVRSWNPLPVGAHLRLSLRPPRSWNQLELDGHVAWVRLAGEHAGMGVRFVEDEATNLKLEKLLLSLAR